MQRDWLSHSLGQMSEIHKTAGDFDGVSFTLCKLMFSVFSASAAVFQTMEETNQRGSEGEDVYGKSQAAP